MRLVLRVFHGLAVLMTAFRSRIFHRGHGGLPSLRALKYFHVVIAARDFQLFGPDHLGALAATGVAAVVGAFVGNRCTASSRWLPRTLAALLLLLPVTGQVRWICSGEWSATWALPLELCDLALLATVAALWTRHRLLFELAYFWGFSGTLLALLTPDLLPGFPDPVFLGFFAAHGGVIVGSVLLIGEGLRCRAGAPWRTLWITLLYAALVGALNALLGSNYIYLCHKPEKASPLDWMGGWPWYLLGAGALAALLFALLDLPFRWQRRRQSRG